MKPTNLISACQSINAFAKAMKEDEKVTPTFSLSKVEAKTLSSFYTALKGYNCDFELLDGYYIGYAIKQISKEFDLLRFGNDTVINIELKSPLDENVKIKKITAQMHQNNYYLKFLGKNVSIYTYIENDGLYKYDTTSQQGVEATFEELIKELSNQNFLDINPDSLFVPNHYLISPFNDTDRFVNQEYFLTNAQEKIKKEILASLTEEACSFTCISANAGTGKTLLLYDLAKTIFMQYGKKSSLIVHCGKLNSGHESLIDRYNWNICSISSITLRSIEKIMNEELDIILIDEAHRIRHWQLEVIIKQAMKHKIKIVFSYDTKQFLSKGETLDLYDYVTTKYPGIQAIKRNLTNRIRTNKKIASFITNLMSIGKSNSDLDYEDISIDYFDSLEDVKEYISYLENKRNWKAITYTNSRYIIEPIDSISGICRTKAHDVIGQEFKKVVLVMDKNFKYGDDNRLMAKRNYYSVTGMLYQIVTRATSELKIIVINNPDLYYKLLEIKSMGE